jgi:hypothetical protein
VITIKKQRGDGKDQSSSRRNTAPPTLARLDGAERLGIAAGVKVPDQGDSGLERVREGDGEGVRAGVGSSEEIRHAWASRLSRS